MRRLLLLPVFLFFALASPGQTKVIDSLKELLKSPVKDTARIHRLDQLSECLWRAGEYEEGKKYAAEELDLLGKTASSDTVWQKRMLARAHTNIGVIASRQGDYPLALNNYNLALGLRQALHLNNEVVGSLMNIAIVYRIQGDYPRALDYNLRALKLGGEGPDNKNLATLYGNIGNVYGSQGDYQKALDYYAKAQKLAEEKNDVHNLTTSLGNIGLCYLNMHDYNSALDFFRRALSKAGTEGDKKSIALNHGNIGAAYRYLGKYDSAITHTLIALKLSEEMKNRNGIASQLNNLGNIYLQQKKYGPAREHFNRSNAIAKQIHARDWIKDNYQYLASIDTLTGNYETALEDYKNFIAYRDSLVNDENTKKTVQMQMQYDFDKKEAADSVRNAEQVKQEALKHEQAIAQQRIYTFGGAIGFALMLVVAGVSFRAYRQKRNDNAVITEQKLLVEEKQREILDSIHYARRIQQSLLPTEKYISKHLTRLCK